MKFLYVLLLEGKKGEWKDFQCEVGLGKNTRLDF